MYIRNANNVDLEPIIELLQSNNLPTEDCAEQLSGFIVVEEDKNLIAIGALEFYGKEALLRSMAVIPSHQGKGIGKTLCAELQQRAAEAGVEKVFLLTEGAVPYFDKLGFEQVTRAETPLTIQATKQFSVLCPSSATIMFCKLTPTTR